MSPRRAAITAELDPAGLRELAAAMQRAAAETAAGVTAGIAITAEATVALEQQLVPVATGALREGIHARYGGEGRSAQVGVWDPDLYYALFVEWGTSIRAAVPFATPAAERARHDYQPNVITEVRRRVR